ncbi:MAG: lysylphosphatidylglycerol synthase transmembrane domain-containing protein [Polaromonas sp.]|nr:lysylphosphatidylglycerol synthase transmembrane domain-containing protein [Polaromonas sp.]
MKPPGQASDIGTDVPQPASPAAAWPVRRLLLVLGVVATAYAIVLLVWGDSPRAQLSRLWSVAGLQAAALCLLNYVLRGWRWRLWMAHYGRHFGWLQGLRLYLAGYAFTPTPGNVGEAMRGMLLARRPLGTAQSLAIFGAERLADLLALLLMCVPALWWALDQGLVRWLWSGSPAAAWLPAGLALAGGLVLLAGWWLWPRLSAGMARIGWLREAGQCLRLQPWRWMGLSLMAWLAQGLAVWLVCREMGLSVDRLLAAGLYAVAMVAGALSALPAGLGGMEVVLTGGLVAAGASAGMAVGITVLVRLLTLWLAVAIGLVALFYSAAIRREISFRRGPGS